MDLWITLTKNGYMVLELGSKKSGAFGSHPLELHQTFLRTSG